RTAAREEHVRARLRAQQPPAMGPDPARGHPSRSGPQAMTGLLTDHDLYLFNEGTHLHLADKLGAHPGIFEGVEGTIFAVWAPNASAVSVVGDFNDWRPSRHLLRPRATSGIWEGFVPG